MRKINTFWNWFQDNNKTIQNLINETPKNQKHIVYWISKNLSYYCKEIDFMFVFPKKGNTTSELIITANGNPEYFKQVIDLIDNAPQLRNWKFTEFIQPIERIDNIINRLDEPYILQEITLKASELQFLPVHDEPTAYKINTIIYMNNYNCFCSTITLRQSIFIILQYIPGKNKLFQNIHFVQLAHNPEQITDVIHLYEFQKYLERQNFK